MRQVTIDKAVMTAMAEGGCLAADVEQAAEAEGLSVVFGAVNETGMGFTLWVMSLSNNIRYWGIDTWRRNRCAYRPAWSHIRQSAWGSYGSCQWRSCERFSPRK